MLLKNIIKSFLTEKQIQKIGNYKIKQIFLKNRKNLKTISDKENYINQQFEKTLGYKINFNEKPKTFNEKIQFRKLYTDDKTNKLYSLCADKYKVRDYVANKIGEQYLIPLYLVTNKLTLEDWNKLPKECVIKANHNSGPVQIIFDKEKEDAKRVIEEIEFQLSVDYGVFSLESYYSLIEKKVIVEKLLKTKEGKVPEDYKIHCFKNKIGEKRKIIQVDSDRYGDHTQNYYSEDFELLDLEAYAPRMNKKLEEISKLKKILELSDKLSEDFDYVRVDFYLFEGKIYFGELTFCPWGGFQKFTPSNWDKTFYEYMI